MRYNVYMNEKNVMTFNEFCTHMWSENCHERRQHGDQEYSTLEEYVNTGANKSFLESEYEKFLQHGRTFLA